MGFARVTIFSAVFLFGATSFAQSAENPPAASADATTVTREETPKSPDANLTYNVLLTTKEERFNVGIFGQFTSFAREGITFSGNSFEVLAGYALTERLGFNVNLMQAIDMADGASVLYSGLRTSGSYTFIGENFSRRSTVMVNGAPSVSIMPFQEPTLSADVGFDQIFFNGTSRVAPGTGMSFGAQYARTISTYRLAFMARYGQLKVGGDPVNLMTAGVGLLFRF